MHNSCAVHISSEIEEQKKMLELKKYYITSLMHKSEIIKKKVRRSKLENSMKIVGKVRNMPGHHRTYLEADEQ